MKPIVVTPHPILSAPARTVTSFDKRLTKLIRDMKTTLEKAANPKGVGLAAPQIGEPWRVFITRPTEKSTIRVFVNPEIIKTSDDTAGGNKEDDNKLEGCLSIPKIWGRVTRAKQLTLKYQDQSGTIHTENFSGFLATIIQHETDHTNGILYVQRVLMQKGKLYQTALDENDKEILEEITVT